MDDDDDDDDDDDSYFSYLFKVKRSIPDHIRYDVGASINL